MDKTKRFHTFGGIVILFLFGFLILSHLGTWIEQFKKMPGPVETEIPSETVSEEQAFFSNLQLIEPPDSPQEAASPSNMGAGETHMTEEEMLIGDHAASS